MASFLFFGRYPLGQAFRFNLIFRYRFTKGFPLQSLTQKLVHLIHQFHRNTSRFIFSFSIKRATVRKIF